VVRVKIRVAKNRSAVSVMNPQYQAYRRVYQATKSIFHSIS
jgi:hypothetical protein